MRVAFALVCFLAGSVLVFVSGTSDIHELIPLGGLLAAFGILVGITGSDGGTEMEHRGH